MRVSTSLIRLLIFSRPGSTLVEAAVKGAAKAGNTVGIVVVNFVAFLGLVEYVYTVLAWCGDKVGYGQLSYKVS